MSRSSPRWRRLDEAFRRNAPFLASSLAPPASASDLAQLQALSWCPPSVIEAYSAHDGARRSGGVLDALPAPEAARWVRVCQWIPVVEALAERERIHELAPPASERWLPIARHGHFRSSDPYNADAQKVIVLDASTDELLAFIYHEYADLCSPIYPLGIGWSSYLDALAERVESGPVSVHSDDYGVLRFGEAERRSVPMRADPATTLLAVLAERGLLRLAREPTATLVDGVRKALRKRGGAPARAAALVAIFTAHDDVDEYFVSEPDLAALLEQFS